MIKHLVIMAAGRSSRMWPLTEYVPKAMALADGKTLIQTAIEKYRDSGMSVHVTVGYKNEVLSPYALGLGVDTLVNTSGKGNSWWIYNSILSKIDEPVMVLTCDSLMDIDIAKLEQNYSDFGFPCCMMLPAKVKDGFEGDFIKVQGHLITDLGRKDKTDLFGSGCQVLNPRKIATLTAPVEDFLEVWTQLISKKQLYAADFTAENWFTFDTVEQLKLYQIMGKSK